MPVDRGCRRVKKPSTRDRGEFRAFFTAMIDDPGFPELDPFAFKLLFALKLNLSAVGIGILRPGTLMDCLGCTAEQRDLQRWQSRSPTRPSVGSFARSASCG